MFGGFGMMMMMMMTMMTWECDNYGGMRCGHQGRVETQDAHNHNNNNNNNNNHDETRRTDTISLVFNSVVQSMRKLLQRSSAKTTLCTRYRETWTKGNAESWQKESRSCFKRRVWWICQKMKNSFPFVL